MSRGVLAGARAGIGIGVGGQLETFDGSGALVRNVSDDVGDGVGLVSEVAISNIDHAHSAESLLVLLSDGKSVFVVDLSLHFRGKLSLLK